jgi:RNA polymerase sigma-B factor
VLGELKRHFRDKGWSIRAPRRIQELYLSIGPAVEELSQRYGRPPTIRELAEITGANTDDLLEALEAGSAYRASSLDAPGPEGEPIANRLGREENAYSTAEERLVLLPHLAALPEREKLILELRYGQDLTQAEIAEQIGISQMHVSRLLARSLAMLHAACDPPE